MFQSNSLSREYLYLVHLFIQWPDFKFQSNSLSREYLYAIDSFRFNSSIQSFNPTPYQGSIYTFKLLTLFHCFNPTPYQGSIYTGLDVPMGIKSSIVSIQLPIKGVFIRKSTPWFAIQKAFQSNSLSREYLYWKLNIRKKFKMVSIQLPIKGVFILLLSKSLIIFSFQGSVSRMR